MKTSAYLVYNTTTGRSYAGTRNAQGQIITRWENPKASLAKVKADAKKRNTRRIYTQSNWKKVSDNGTEQTFEAILKKTNNQQRKPAKETSMDRIQKYVVIVNYLEALAQGTGNPDQFMDTLALRGWDITPAEDLLVEAELLANEYATAGASKDEFDIQFYCIAKDIAEKI